MPTTPQTALADRAAQATRLLKLMASESRLLILCHLSDGEMSVGELSRTTGLSVTATSQHLSRMRAEGLVSTRRDAQSIFYRLSDDAARALISTLCTIYNPKDHSHE